MAEALYDPERGELVLGEPEDHTEGLYPDPSLIPHPLTEDEVKRALQAELEEASGEFAGGEFERRRRGLESYMAEKLGNEQEGRSQVVLSDVRDTVESLMPTLMVLFTGSEYLGRYEPQVPEDEAAHETATKWADYVFFTQNPGFSLLHDGFKDALIESSAVFMVYLEELIEGDVHTYRGLSELELGMLLQGGEFDVLELSEREEAGQGFDGTPIVIRLVDVRVRNMARRKRVRVELIPNEEFRVSKRAKRVDKRTPFQARMKRCTASDLVAMGYDPAIVAMIPPNDDEDWNEHRLQRYSEDEDYPVADVDRPDPASRPIWVVDAYMRIDEDGDGYAELRHIVAAGPKSNLFILDDEEVNDTPFCTITPVPMPHKWAGLSMADLVDDLQRIRSTLLRQILDNVYVTNNPRTIVLDGYANYDDLLTSAPGGIIREYQPGSIRPYEQPPLGQGAFSTLEYLHGVKENRVGVTRYNQGTDANTLNQTARGLAAIMEAANQRIDLIARIFAEGGVKDVFRKILRVSVDAGLQPQTFRLRNAWVKAAPAEWNPEMDVAVEVGIGTAQRVERMQNMRMVLETQFALAERGLTQIVTPEKVYRALSKMTEAAGFKVPGLFFADPANQPPPPPKPDPDLIDAESKAKTQEARVAIEAQKLDLDGKKAADAVVMKEMELASREAIERERIESQEKIALAKIEADRENARVQAEAKAASGGEED